MALNPDDSDSENPDRGQMELVKKLHREMADRRIIVNMKTKFKMKKRRNLTSQVYHLQTAPSTSSGSDPDQNRHDHRTQAAAARRSRSLSRPKAEKQRSKGYESDSTDEYSIGSDDVKQKVELSSTRNKMAEARVTNTEGKLADYNQKLNKRTEKLNELHIKLKLRKDKMMEREERLRQFEKALAEKELQVKQRNDSLRKKEIDLETFSNVIKGKETLMADYEQGVNERANALCEKEKTYGVQLSRNGVYEKQASGNSSGTKPAHPTSHLHHHIQTRSPKPILTTADRSASAKKRISWADSAISSSGSPTQDTSSDDDSIHRLSVSARLKRFENRLL